MNRVVVLALLLAAAGYPTYPIRAPAFSTLFRLQLTYDDNPFRYSGDDREAFRNSQYPERFPFRSLDDLELGISASLRYRYRLQSSSGFIRLRAKTHQYVSNPDKSYGLAELEFGQELWQDSRLEVSSFYMPNFLIRYYRNPEDEGSEYVGCRFSEHLLGLGLVQRIGRLSIGPVYRYEGDDYSRPFDFYDTKAHRFGGAFSLALAKGFEVGAEYERKLARAIGPVPDISYGQHGFELWASSRPARLRRLSFDAKYGMRHRNYTTENPAEVDPSHLDRTDDLAELGFELGYRLGAAKVMARYELEWREVTAPHRERIEDIKEYRRSLFTVGLVLSSTLWEVEE